MEPPLSMRHRELSKIMPTGTARHEAKGAKVNSIAWVPYSTFVSPNGLGLVRRINKWTFGTPCSERGY